MTISATTEELLGKMFLSFGIENRKQYEIYVEFLNQSGIDDEIIAKRIIQLTMTWRPKYGNKIPTIPEIIGEDVETNDNAEMEKAWQFFLKTCCNNYRMEPMEDWVYTIKNMLGKSYVEDRTDEEEKWIKKEFMKIYPAVRKGKIAVQEQQVQFEKNGNTFTQLFKEKQDNDDVAKLLEKFNF